MRPTAARSRPLGPDLAVVAGVMQVLVALGLFFLPLSETCVGFRSLESQKLGCSYESYFDVYGLTLNGPVLGLIVLLAAGVVLAASARIQDPGLRALWPWLAVALNGVGLILAWRVIIWFLPTTVGAVCAAIALWRAPRPKGRTRWTPGQRGQRRHVYESRRRIYRRR